MWDASALNFNSIARAWKFFRFEIKGGILGLEGWGLGFRV